MKNIKTQIMAQFNLEDALALVPMYNGSNEQLNSFIRSIQFAKKMFPADQEYMCDFNICAVFLRVTRIIHSGDI